VVVIAGLLLLTQRPADQTGTDGLRTTTSTDATPVDAVHGSPAGAVEASLAGGSRADLVRHSFRLEAPGAQQVCLVGDFNRWKVCATPLERIKDNLWQISVELKKGRHEYMFVVDNEWISDPRASVQVDDGFGHRNAVLIL
jgi:1,4-alpha-glucan branching enzyme